MYSRRGWMDIWKKAEREDKLTARVVVCPWVYPDVDMNEQLREFEIIHRGMSTDSRLMVNQVKILNIVTG